MLNSFAGYNHSSGIATEITGVEMTENAEHTGRGNQNEISTALKVNVSENETISLKNMVLVKNAATQPSDVKEIIIYSTGSLDTLDTRTLKQATLPGKAPLSKKSAKIRLLGNCSRG